jgi:hypothetical protein
MSQDLEEDEKVYDLKYACVEAIRYITVQMDRVRFTRDITNEDNMNVPYLAGKLKSIKAFQK